MAGGERKAVVTDRLFSCKKEENINRCLDSETHYFGMKGTKLQKEVWVTEDNMKRKDTKWLNAILIRIAP